MKVAIVEDENRPFRPQIGETDLDTVYRKSNVNFLVHKCWAEDPDMRPTTKTILRNLNKINPFK